MTTCQRLCTIVPLFLATLVAACVSPPAPTARPPTVAAASPTSALAERTATPSLMPFPTLSPVPTSTTTSTPTSPPAPTAPLTPTTSLPTSTPASQPEALPTPPFYEDLSRPASALASYYNAINRREYERAYGYWASPPQPYATFASGFADTASAVAIVGPYALPNRPREGDPRTGVPVLLFARHTDGSEHLFYGCFFMQPAELAGPFRWQIYDATLRVAPSADITLLENACAPWRSILHNPRYDVATKPEDLIFSYYNAIVQRDYARAYAYWELPPQPFDAFVAGFADTASAFVSVIPPQFEEGAMGSLYSAVPVMIVAWHHDGSRSSFVGCFATRRPNPAMVGEERPWRLFNAQVHPVPGASTAVRSLLDARELCP